MRVRVRNKLRDYEDEGIDLWAVIK
jgi:hypothetical protein